MTSSDTNRRRSPWRPRPTWLVLAVAALLTAALAAPASATVDRLSGPDPAIWLSDPDGVDGDSGTEQSDPIAGADGRATVNSNGATIRVHATGLEHGHAYTMWVVYFSDSGACIDGCNGPDLALEDVAGGVLFGDGKVAGATGTATFSARLRTGDGSEYPPPPPPPFAFAPYEAGPANEFHIVIRSHGPKLPGEVADQISSFGGGCEVEVGPAPEEIGDFPVPAAPGECGDIQLYVFS